MSADAIARCVRVEVDAGGLAATLRIAPGTDPAALDELALRAVAAERGLPTTPELLDSLREVLAAHRAAPDAALERVIASGTPPVHGQDGGLVFEPGFDPADIEAALIAAAAQPETAAPDPGAGPAGSVDHYARSVIRTVQPGDVIARVTPPGEHADGRDVLGRTLAARPGKPFPLTTDDSVQVRPDGSVLALRPGKIEHRGHLLRVSDKLVIPGSVDFSTGHVEFSGHLLVRRGVRDLFKLQVGRSLTVHGLVEAASLEVKLDAMLDGGMAARGQGRLAAGRDAKARYLDGVHAQIGRDLEVENEIVACDLVVGRRFRGEGCTLKGGRLTTGGGAEIGSLGSEAGVQTEVIVGSLPAVEALIPRIDALLPEIEARVGKAESNLKQLQAPGGRLSPRHAEELTELQFEVVRLKEPQAALRRCRDRVTELLAHHTDASLTIRRRVHAGTRVRLGGFEILFTADAKGPLRLALEHGRPVLTDLLSNEPADLARVARVRRVDAGPETRAEPGSRPARAA